MPQLIAERSAMASWEERFAAWAKGPGISEDERIENAISGVRKAIAKDAFLAANTKVYVQGSYRNRVNVRQESDVDFGVIYTGNSFFAAYPEATTRAAFGNVAADYSYKEFKNAIGIALVNHFGPHAVSRGNKAFDVHENTYRIDADVVPTFEHRRYNANGTYHSGVQLYADDGTLIINWPERLFDAGTWPDQHYENGVAKNQLTARAYKRVVRILKRVRCRMIDDGGEVAKNVPGFLVECLLYNVPNIEFTHTTWDRCLQGALLFLWANTREAATCKDWCEVSELKYIFRGSPDSKRMDVHAFIDKAWDYVGVRS